MTPLPLAWSIDSVGAHTAFGPQWERTWSGLLAGDSPPITRYEGLGVTPPTPVIAAAQVDRTSSESAISHLARSVLAQLSLDEDAPLYLATNHGDSDRIIQLARDGTRSMTEQADKEALAKTARPLAPSGPLVQSACASGLVALILACLHARRSVGTAGVLAVDTLSDLECIGFRAARALSETRAKPFSADRNGLTIGEGAAGVTIQWGAPSGRMRPSIIGFGLSCDAHHPTSPEPEGRQIELAWRKALAMAGVLADDVSAVILHGTGTQANDEVETRVYNRIWKRSRPPTCSLKGSIGHAMGPAGLLNLLAAVGTLRDGLLPPTLAHEEAHALLPIAFEKPQKLERRGPILVAASGFGGQNAAVVVANV